MRRSLTMFGRSLFPSSWNRNMPTDFRDPFSTLQQEMNRLFETFGSVPSRWSNDMMAMPRIDVCETDKAIEVEAELPGFDEKNVDVTLAGDVLTIRGERKNGEEKKEKNYHLSERSWGSFTRSVTLPFMA